MVEIDTVLVLGAGASACYKFPTGARLTEELSGTHTNSPHHISGLKALLGSNASAVNQFTNRFRYSGEYSIDSFLSKQPANEQALIETGKQAIAYFIAARENLEILQSTPIDIDWYRYLWVKVSSNARRIEDLGRNRLKVITFNYDRSLEAYLHQKIMYSFSVSSMDAYHALKSSFKIHHVYGSLSSFTVDDRAGGRLYQPIASKEELERATGEILTMFDDRANSASHEYQEWLVAADKIAFLGFGFDSDNIRRIRFREAIQSRIRFDANAQTFVGKPLELFLTTRRIQTARLQKIKAELGVATLKTDLLHVYETSKEAGFSDQFEIKDALEIWDLL